jgi:hypothetical protein
LGDSILFAAVVNVACRRVFDTRHLVGASDARGGGFEPDTIVTVAQVGVVECLVEAIEIRRENPLVSASGLVFTIGNHAIRLAPVFVLVRAQPNFVGTFRVQAAALVNLTSVAGVRYPAVTCVARIDRVPLLWTGVRRCVRLLTCRLGRCGIRSSVRSRRVR